MASIWKRSGVYLDLIYTFPGAILAGTALGWFVDRKTGWSPYGTLVGFFLGVGAAFWYLFKMLGGIQRDDGDA